MHGLVEPPPSSARTREVGTGLHPLAVAALARQALRSPGPAPLPDAPEAMPPACRLLGLGMPPSATTGEGGGGARPFRLGPLVPSVVPRGTGRGDAASLEPSSP